MSRKILGLALVVFGIASFSLVVNMVPRNAHTLFVNGTMYTLDKQNRVVEAVAIRGNRIVAVGSSRELLEQFTADTVIDLVGKTIVPGFIDSHGHVEGLGALLQSLVLVGVPSVDEVRDAVRECVEEAEAGEWIIGRGWDQNLWEQKEFPTAAMLDDVAPDNPVVLIRIDGHASWVNGKAMSIAGLNRDTPDPEGSKIIRYTDGRPTGILLEDNARILVERHIPPPTDREIERTILVAAAECVRNGITEIADLGVEQAAIDAYMRLADDGKLPIRIYAAISAPGPTWDAWSRGEGKHSPLIGYGDGMFSVRAMKLYSDGALGSRGAALVEEYNDDPGNRGVTRIGDDELETNIRLAVMRGFQPCVHAIGDRGNHMVLNAFERALSPGARNDVRPRIEHVQVLLPSDVPRFGQLRILPSMQPVHCTSDMYWAEARLGSQRVQTAYAWRSLLETGSIILSGSDVPNDDLSPLVGFYAAITRSDRNAYPRDGWYGRQRMTREEALRSYTSWAAYGLFQEDLKGTIEIGKLADLTILSKDIMQIEPQEILTTDVEMTIVGGRIVYSRPSPSEIIP